MHPNPLGQSTLTSENKTGTIILFGEVLADIFPDRSVLGGAPFNVARHLKKFGQNPILLTRIGNDKLRDELLTVMSANNMDVLGLQLDNHHPTGQVQVHIENKSHRFDLLPLQAYDFINSERVRLSTRSIHPSLLYFGTLAQRHPTSRGALHSLLRNKKTSRFLDINLRSPWYDEKTIRYSLKQADIVKLNDNELTLLSEMFALVGDNPQQQAGMLVKQFNLQFLIVTCGKAGAWQLNNKGELLKVGTTNAPPVVVDTVGAGDGFAAVCILGELQRWPIPETLARANHFAAAICTLRGAVPDHNDFYLPFTQAWNL
ncbi:MAG: carbohydrate kinase [Gallionella sp.]